MTRPTDTLAEAMRAAAGAAWKEGRMLTVNPANVLAVLDEREALSREVEELRTAFELETKAVSQQMGFNRDLHAKIDKAVSDILEAEARGRKEGVFAAQEAITALVKTGEFDWQEIVNTLAALQPDPPDAREWLPIRTAPQDDTCVIVSDGEMIWISSQKTEGPPHDKLHPSAHGWYMKMGSKPPRFWMPLPTLPRQVALP